VPIEQEKAKQGHDRIWTGSGRLFRVCIYGSINARIADGATDLEGHLSTYQDGMAHVRISLLAVLYVCIYTLFTLLRAHLGCEHTRRSKAIRSRS
jgi:hypothetical protein